MFFKLLFLLAFYVLLGWGFTIERAHPGPASQFLPMWAWIGLALVGLPAAMVSLKTNSKMMKIADNVHQAVRELQRREQLRGFDAFILMLARLAYGGMAIWCVIFLYYHFRPWQFPVLYPVVAAILLVNLAYNTVVQLVVWSSLRRTSVTLDDLYEMLPK